MYTWSAFNIYDIVPFDVPRSIQLISRLDFNEDAKNHFIIEIKNHLRRTHLEFIGNPLLCIIMLITFSDVGKISSKRHEFYEDAFNALWRKHDARKGYQRERYTGLEKTKFLKLLCAF